MTTQNPEAFLTAFTASRGILLAERESALLLTLVKLSPPWLQHGIQKTHRDGSTSWPHMSRRALKIQALSQSRGAKAMEAETHFRVFSDRAASDLEAFERLFKAQNERRFFEVELDHGPAGLPHGAGPKRLKKL